MSSNLPPKAPSGIPKRSTSSLSSRSQSSDKPSGPMVPAASSAVRKTSSDRPTVPTSTMAPPSATTRRPVLGARRVEQPTIRKPVPVTSRAGSSTAIPSTRPSTQITRPSVGTARRTSATPAPSRVLARPSVATSQQQSSALISPPKPETKPPPESEPEAQPLPEQPAGVILEAAPISEPVPESEPTSIEPETFEIKTTLDEPQTIRADSEPQPSPPVEKPPTSPAIIESPPVKLDVPENWVELETKYKQDIEALAESTEMATIEKEIAEEKLDSCERELQELKDKLADAALQIDMLKREQQASEDQHMGGAGRTSTGESTVTAFQLQKIEEQNEVLKQALIKLRDISTKDKKVLEDLQLERDELELKVLDFEEREQRHLEQIKVFEEQIDVNQSAQEMVEKLAQQKTDLEDKLRELADDLDNMEKLRDLDEQLLEGARENEIELTGQLDRLRVQYSEAVKKRHDLEDYLTDQERTLAKLKDENRQLSDQITIFRNQFKEGESIEQQKHQIENVAYKLNFSESKMAEKEAELTRCRRNLADMEEQMNNLSQITKEQSARYDELKLQYESKVMENSELQRALKKKMEEVCELEIRRDMAEKKLQTIQRDTEAKINNLNRTIEMMRGVEVQHEEDLKRLMEDNELIERERRELRDQLNKSARSLERSIQATANMSIVSAQDASLASLGISFQTPSTQSSPQHVAQTAQLAVASVPVQGAQQSAVVAQTATGAGGGSLTVGASRALAMSPGEASDEASNQSRIKCLSDAFDQLNRRNYELEMELAFRELNSRVPPSASLGPTSAAASATGGSLSAYYDVDRAHALRAEAIKLKREIRDSIINQQICPKSRLIHSHLRNEHFNGSKLALRYQQLENEISSLMSNSTTVRMRPRAPILHSTPVK